MAQRPEVASPPDGVSLVFSVSMWPLVLVTIPPALRDEDIDYLRSAYEPVFAAPRRHVLIVDTTTIVTIPDARLRRRLKDFEAENRPIILQRNIGSAIVMSNTLVRGAYTALRWISPPTTPSPAFSNLGEAARWCIEVIRADGQEAPATAYTLAGTSK